MVVIEDTGVQFSKKIQDFLQIVKNNEDMMKSLEDTVEGWCMLVKYQVKHSGRQFMQYQARGVDQHVIQMSMWKNGNGEGKKEEGSTEGCQEEFSRFLETTFIKNEQGYFTLREAKECYPNKLFVASNPAQFRKMLEEGLNVKYIKQKSIKGKVRAGVYLGYCIKEGIL